MLVVFTGIESKVNGLPIDGIPEKLFIGIGYNPNLNTLGERLDMLDFFYWTNKFPTPQWTIWDASAYYIVNKIQQKKFKSLGPNFSVKQLLDTIVEEFNRPKRAEIRKNCYLRQVYLVLISCLFKRPIEIVNAYTMIQGESDKTFAEALELALDYTRRLERDSPKLMEQIYVKNSNPASRLYLPLEIAETIYLNRVDGIGGKFGTITEMFFDEAILGCMKQSGIPYKVFWCPKGPRKIPYLDDQKVIRTFTTDSSVEKLLQDDKEYADYVARYISPLSRQGESLFDSVRRIRDKIRSDSIP